MTSEFEALAVRCAEASGQNVLFGVRPHGRGWFAHCDGIEYDGDPDSALDAIHTALMERARKMEGDAIAEMKAAISQLNILMGGEA